MSNKDLVTLVLYGLACLGGLGLVLGLLFFFVVVPIASKLNETFKDIEDING